MGFSVGENCFRICAWRGSVGHGEYNVNEKEGGTHTSYIRTQMLWLIEITYIALPSLATLYMYTAFKLIALYDK